MCQWWVKKKYKCIQNKLQNWQRNGSTLWHIYNIKTFNIKIYRGMILLTLYLCKKCWFSFLSYNTGENMDRCKPRDILNKLSITRVPENCRIYQIFQLKKHSVRQDVSVHFILCRIKLADCPKCEGEISRSLHNSSVYNSFFFAIPSLHYLQYRYPWTSSYWRPGQRWVLLGAVWHPGNSQTSPPLPYTRAAPLFPLQHKTGKFRIWSTIANYWSRSID